MDSEELTEAFVEEFGCSRSEAQQVAKKCVQYVSNTEESGLTDQMQDPDYIINILRKKPDTNSSLKSRWNWWIGMLHPKRDVSRYQVK